MAISYSLIMITRTINSCLIFIDVLHIGFIKCMILLQLHNQFTPCIRKCQHRMRVPLCLILGGLLLLSMLVNITNSERICFSCSGITQDRLCQHAISCDKDEVCFVQKYYTHGNETKYDVGCTFQEMCQTDETGHVIGRRNEHAHIICQKCCNDSNVCNHDLSCQNTKLDRKLDLSLIFNLYY
ncbi:uncharacterized protein [Mytilus edulis]|uniref:uncharacterized protein n=1 Tax=Mytilus edulis TaxID=6550 RepID=UPI0039F11E03